MIFAIRNYSLLVYFLSNSLYGMSLGKARGETTNFHKFYSPVIRTEPELRSKSRSARTAGEEENFCRWGRLLRMRYRRYKRV